VPLKGEYNLSGSDAWPTFVAILERDGFYSLRLTPKLLDDLQTAVFALPWECGSHSVTGAKTPVVGAHRGQSQT
jgi:hypothetical protein